MTAIDHTADGGRAADQLSTMQRGLYVAIGLGLAASATKPRPNPLLNVLALAGGAYLAWRGAVGTCPVKGAVTGMATHLPHREASA